MQMCTSVSALCLAVALVGCGGSSGINVESTTCGQLESRNSSMNGAWRL